MLPCLSAEDSSVPDFLSSTDQMAEELAEDIATPEEISYKPYLLLI